MKKERGKKKKKKKKEWKKPFSDKHVRQLQ
jgi:hypothetical protein